MCVNEIEGVSGRALEPKISLSFRLLAWLRRDRLSFVVVVVVVPDQQRAVRNKSERMSAAPVLEELLEAMERDNLNRMTVILVRQ